MTNILLIIIIIELGVVLYLKFKKLPEEVQREIKRKVVPIKADVFEYVAPEDEGVKKSRELTEEITK